MQTLRERISGEDSHLASAVKPQNKDFALSKAFGQRKDKAVTRPSYKAVTDERGHVKFGNNGTRVAVEDTNTGKHYLMPLQAIKRYCDLISGGSLKATEEEKKNAEVLQRAVAPALKAQNGMKLGGT
ncbi:MAG: hypothetical protein EA357_04570 [Micavibrio sp.]|nr:MAG: hypothetical protein EA357_04570 [Micavibrio sp.]